MSEPTTSGGGSTRPAREQEHRERAGEIGDEREQSVLARTNRTAAEAAAIFAAAAGYASEHRTVDADRGRVLELLHNFQQFVASGAIDHWDVDPHQAHADLQYAADAVRRFPSADAVKAPEAGRFDVVGWVFVPQRLDGPKLAYDVENPEDVMACRFCPFRAIGLAAMVRHGRQEHAGHVE